MAVDNDWEVVLYCLSTFERLRGRETDQEGLHPDCRPSSLGD